MLFNRLGKPWRSRTTRHKLLTHNCQSLLENNADFKGQFQHIICFMSMFTVVCLSICLFVETLSPYVAQAGLALPILLP